MYMKCDPDIDSTSAFPELGQAYGCSPDGTDNTSHSVRLTGKAKFAHDKWEIALRKYEDAVRLYATTDISVRQIAKECHVSEGGFQAHLYRWHRPLMLVRYGVDLKGRNPKEVKLGSKRGQRHITREKNAPAVEACKSTDYIQFSISAIAREFGLNETGLGSQHLRFYHRRLLVNKESEREQAKQRKKKGLMSGNGRTRDPLPETVEKYSETIRLYETTGESLKSIAARLGLVYNSVGGYVRRHYPELIRRHEALVAKERESGTE